MDHAPDLQEKMTPDFKALCESMTRLSTDALKETLKNALIGTVENLMSAAAALLELDKRGERLTGGKVSGDKYLFALLRKVASGKWAPAAILRFGDDEYLQEKVLSLPRDKQDEVLQGSDEEVREYVERMTAEAREKVKQEAPGKPGSDPTGPAPETPARKPIARHVITQAQYDEVKRENELLRMENKLLREHVADLQKAFDALPQHRKARERVPQPSM